ncbi:hypothetical protein F4802DRAFT_599655 [Xylaria palmicola]|nr:hypothetical protein F4802DRAFT_599655 [Xylaria palmicola]
MDGPSSSSSSSSPSFMALETVGHVVAALADAFAAGLECHADWLRRQREQNHYRTRGPTDGSAVGSGLYAARTSLETSRRRIEDVFGSGADVLGDEFVAGDAACRDILLCNLCRLRTCVAGLERDVGSGRRPLPLAELVCASEAVRASCLAALHKQYQRVVVGRLVPRALAPAPALSPPADDEESRAEGTDAGIEVEVEVKVEIEIEAETAKVEAIVTPETRLKASSRGSSNTIREPPSPPLTPTRVSGGEEQPELLEDNQSAVYARSVGSFDPRPHNSVFSVFCPEAMKYQVDVEKALPLEGTRCGCGYDWNAAGRGAGALVVRDGFRITPRFLGKSHCKGGLGCVLCTVSAPYIRVSEDLRDGLRDEGSIPQNIGLGSTGRTETFGSVDGLRMHINSSHTKWQLLHDRDLAGQ